MAETRTVVVTGASTGIGAAAVAALVRDGMVVWATVRRQPDADRLTAEHGHAVRPLLMDWRTLTRSKRRGRPWLLRVR